jgi:hypothetical protein
MKAIVNNTEYKLDKFPFPKRGAQAEGYYLVDDEDGTQLLSRVTRAPSGAYTYVMYGDVSYSFPRHVEFPSGTVVQFSEGTVSKTKTAPKPVVDDAVLTNVLEEAIATREAYPNFLEGQLTQEEDPMEKAARFVNEQETKRGLGQAPTIAEYLPPVKPKNKPPRRAPAK